jgi:hypothetical protein
LAAALDGSNFGGGVDPPDEGGRGEIVIQWIRIRVGPRSGITRSSGSLIVDQLDRLDRRERPLCDGRVAVSDGDRATTG